MQTYKSEILDGLQEKIEKDNTLAIDCEIVKSFDSEDVSEDIKKVIASLCPSNPDQKDLHYVNAILVSNGWNKNDDVFDKAELWSARATPEDKPFNLMHNEDDIIGHITGSMVLDIDGNEVEEFPEENFDIVISSVIYKAWSDLEQAARIQELVEEIKENKWSVSMECFFGDFDYAIISPEGNKKVVARNDESSFLTKHLRAYGGKGEYDGYKVGRLLKQISFTGVGLVDKPANPRSIIFTDDLKPFISAGGTAMAVENKSIAELETSVVELSKKIEAATLSISEKDKQIASKDALIKELQDALESTKSESETRAKKMGEMEEEVKETKKTVKNMKRRASLVEAGVATDKVDEILTKFDAADDGMFDSVVALYKGVAKPVEAPVATETEVEVEDEVEVEAEASELNDAGDNTTPNQKAVASAIEWFSDVFKTTAKAKGVK